MKHFVRTLPFVCLLLGGVASAQTSVTGVSTIAQNKIAVLEEFTGVRCPNCPDGHAVLATMVASHPNDLIFVSYHPDNSSYTTPYTGDPDLQRTYPDPFYSMPYCGTSRFMPSAFINRREYAGEKIQGRGAWPGHVDAMVLESSPLNVGVIANYDETNKILSVTAEAYYTSTVTDQNSMYVVLVEDGIVVQTQSGATGAYTQNHVFREGFAAQWGDAVSPTTMGSLVQFTYTFDNTARNYDMSKCYVMAFVENKTNEELYSGAQASVTIGGVSAAAPSELTAKVYPNPSNGYAYLDYTLAHAGQASYTLTTVHGAQVMHADLGIQDAGTHRETIDARDLAKGIYILKMESEGTSLTRRLVIQ